MADPYKPSGKTVDEIKAEHKALFEELDSLRSQEPEMVSQLYQKLHETMKSVRNQIATPPADWGKREESVQVERQADLPDLDDRFIGPQIDEYIRLRKEEWEEERRHLAASASAADKTQDVAFVDEGKFRRQLEDDSQQEPPPTEKQVVDSQQIDDYIRMRRDKWNRERERPTTASGDVSYDPGFQPVVNLEDEMFKLEMRLKDALENTQRTFERITHILSDYNHGIESAHNQLYRFRTTPY